MQTSPSRLAMSSGDWLLLVGLSVLWGGAFFFAKVAVAEVPPFTLALGRVGIAVAVLAPLALAGAGAALRELPWRAFVVMGLLNNVLPFSLIFWGQSHIPSGLASILNATTPLFTVLVAHVATSDDKLTRARIGGLAAGFLGVIVMIGPSLIYDIGVHVLASFACLLGACCYAAGGVYWRGYRHIAPLPAAAGQLGASTIMLAALSAATDRPWELAFPSLNAWGAIIALGVLSTALAYLIFFRVLGRAGATNVMLVTFLIPISAIVLGTFVLGERLALHQFLGMVAIMIGLVAIDGRLAQRLGTFGGR